MLTPLKFAIVLVFFFPVLAAGQEKFLLQAKYPEGKYRTQSTQEDVTQSAFAQVLLDYRSSPPQETKKETEALIQIGPTDAEGVVRVDSQFTKYKITYPSEGDATELSPEEREKKRQMQREMDNAGRIACEAKTWMLLNPKLGKILEIHGYDEINDRVIETTSLPSLKKEYESAQQSFGDEKTKEYFESYSRIYPDHPVSVGEQWTTSPIALVPILAKMELKMTNTFKEIKTDSEGRRIAVIESHSKWSSEEPGKFGPWEIECHQAEVVFDSTMELELEAGLEISDKKQIRVAIKQRIDYPSGPYWVASVAKRTETTSLERVEEAP